MDRPTDQPWSVVLAVVIAVALAVSLREVSQQRAQIRYLEREQEATQTALVLQMERCAKSCPNLLRSGHPDAAMLLAAAEAEGVPPLVYFGVVTAETRYSANPPRGKAGEVGRLQITPRYWETVCGSQGWDIHTPNGNARCGAHVLRQCHDRLGSWQKAVQCYNQASLSPRTVRYLQEVQRWIGNTVLRSFDE